MKLIKPEINFYMDMGAPCPLLIADDRNLRVIFYAENDPNIPLKEQICKTEPIVELVFKDHFYCSFSPPNDEALNGHPYWDLGMAPYTFHELLESDLITKLASYDRYHRYYNPKAYDGAHHYVITFKDQLFECVARSFEVFKHSGSVNVRGMIALREIEKKLP